MIIEQQPKNITANLRKKSVIMNMLDTFLCISSDKALLQGVYLCACIVLVELGYNCLSTGTYYLK